jgi:hypothetical protein
LQKAQSLGLPIDDSSIHVRITAPSPADQDTGNLLTTLGIQERSINTGHVYITVSYGVPHRFPSGVKIIHFHFAVSDRGI